MIFSIKKNTTKMSIPNLTKSIIFKPKLNQFENSKGKFIPIVSFFSNIFYQNSKILIFYFADEK